MIFGHLTLIIFITYSYLKKNSTLDMSARDHQINQFLRDAVASSIILKKNVFRYALPPRKTTERTASRTSVGKKKPGKVIFGRLKPRKRTKKMEKED